MSLRGRLEHQASDQNSPFELAPIEHAIADDEEIGL
jgi:hypothetical protein